MTSVKIPIEHNFQDYQLPRKSGECRPSEGTRPAAGGQAAGGQAAGVGARRGVARARGRAGAHRGLSGRFSQRERRREGTRMAPAWRTSGDVSASAALPRRPTASLAAGDPEVTFGAAADFCAEIFIFGSSSFCDYQDNAAARALISALIHTT